MALLNLGPRGSVIATLLASIIAVVGFYQAPLPLIRAWWASPHEYPDPLRVRNRIASGLILSGQLIGRHREDVVALLGEPLPTEYMGAWSEWSLVYDLGVERGLIVIDDECLVLRISANGTVTEAEILTDC